MVGEGGLEQPGDVMEFVRRAAREGEIADLRRLRSDRRRVPAQLLSELLTIGETDARDVRLAGARIVGPLDLRSRRCLVGLSFVDCTFAEAPAFDRATVPALDLHRCVLPGLSADGVQVEHDLELSACQVVGEVNLRGARIGGSLRCGGLTLTNRGADALIGDHADIGADVLLVGAAGPSDEPMACRITGAVSFLSARVRGWISSAGAVLANHGGDALVAHGAEIGAGVFLGPLELDDGAILQCRIEGAVRMLGSRIGGPLRCVGVTLDSAGSDALVIDQAEVGDVSLEPWDSSRGETFECNVTGAVRLVGARVAGGVSLQGATLSNPGGAALVAEDVHVRSSVLLRARSRPGSTPVPCTVAGDIWLPGAQIGGVFNCTGAELAGELDLRRCRASELVDDLTVEDGRVKGSWSGARPLRLEGFSYDRFGGEATWDHVARFAWLDGMDGYRPGPWEQLQRVYLQNGHEDEGRLAAIEKQRDRLRRGGLSHRQKLWRWILAAIVGHGYRPARAGWWALGAIALLSVVTWLARGDMTYVGEANRSFRPWTAFAYAADTFLPVAEFDVAGDWRAHGWLDAVRFGFVAMGWVLGSIFVAGFTKIVRS